MQDIITFLLEHWELSLALVVVLILIFVEEYRSYTGGGARIDAAQAVGKVEWTKRRSPSPLCAKKRMPAGMRITIAGRLFPLTAIVFILLARGRRIAPTSGNTAACTPVTVRYA